VGDINRVILTGNLGADPEIRYLQSGKCVASFNLAVRRDKETTDWIPVICWEKVAEACGNSISKGSKVLVEGRIQVRSYETNDGQKRKITEVVAGHVEFLDRKLENKDNPFGGEVLPEEELPF